MNDTKNQKKQISPLYKISYFVGSEESHQFNLTSVSIALLFVIARYASMSPDGICKAHHEKIMKDARIKSSTSYGNHLRILQNANLIKSSKNWKLGRHELGSYFDKNISGMEHNISSDLTESPTNNVSKNQAIISSTTFAVGDQQRLPLATIENKKKESIKKNNSNLIYLREKKRKILYEKKEDNMGKEKYLHEDEQYVKFFYNQGGVGGIQNATHKKLSASQEYINRQRSQYHEARRKEELRDKYGAAYLEAHGIPMLDWKTFSLSEL